MWRRTLQTVSHFGHNKGHVEVVYFSRKLLVQKQMYLMRTRRRSQFLKLNRQNDVIIQPTALPLKLTSYFTWVRYWVSRYSVKWHSPSPNSSNYRFKMFVGRAHQVILHVGKCSPFWPSKHSDWNIVSSVYDILCSLPCKALVTEPLCANRLTIKIDLLYERWPMTCVGPACIASWGISIYSD